MPIEPTATSEPVLASFHAMWDLFPEPVMLVHRDRTILASNSLGRTYGIVPGGKCHQLNPLAGGSHCQGCMANEALKLGQAIVTPARPDAAPVTGYWVPVQGEPELYIHFGIGMRALQEAKA